MACQRSWPSRLLLIDAGNTRLKYKLINALAVEELRDVQLTDGNYLRQQIVEKIVAVEPVYIANAELKAVNGGAGENSLAVDKLRELVADPGTLLLMSTVAQGAVMAVLKAWQAELQVIVEAAHVTQSALGVSMRYAHIASLGVDRWLAMIAAYQKASAGLCVIDCGTAITVDFLSSTGVHEGGLIAPGFTTCLTSLNLADSLKSAVQAVASHPHGATSGAGGVRHDGLGLSSAACIFHGVDRMTVAFLDSIFAQARRFEPAREIFITGGGWPALEYEPAVDYRYERDLVFEGLILSWVEGLTRPFLPQP